MSSASEARPACDPKTPKPHLALIINYPLPLSLIIKSIDMFGTLQELKDTYETARQAIDRTKEPKDELRRLSEFIHHLADNVDEGFKGMDEPYTKFFYDDFCPGLVKRLVRERSTDDEVSSFDYF